jgi:hypothetical protein
MRPAGYYVLHSQTKVQRKQAPAETCYNERRFHMSGKRNPSQKPKQYHQNDPQNPMKRNQVDSVSSPEKKSENNQHHCEQANDILNYQRCSSHISGVKNLS